MKFYIWTFLFLFFTNFISCKKDKPVSYLIAHDYPAEVREIFLTKCSTAGCHNTLSKDAASGLDLSSWEKLFEGGRNGASVLPYQSEFSFLFSFLNTYPELGGMLKPTMPFGENPLSFEEVLLVKKWIEEGAPSASGKIMYAENPNRKKVYVVNQGCDQVAVYDAKSGLIMKYVQVGKDPSIIEAPHMIKFSPDGKFWYLVFTNSTVMQRFSSVDDAFAGQVEIGNGTWNTLSISSDSKKAYCVDWNLKGRIAVVNLDQMILHQLWQSASELYVNPHGSSLGRSDSVLYLTSQSGNFIYKVDVYGGFTDPAKISLETGVPPKLLGDLYPHDILFSKDRSMYFVTCQNSNEVKIMNAFNDSVLSTVQVGDFPQEMAISTSYGLLFVTCMEDQINNFKGRGSVAVIDYRKGILLKHIAVASDGSSFLFQPHGIVVDEEEHKIYIANRNIIPGGPAPHHTGTCTGRNGYVSIINLKTLELTDYKSETLVDPFTIGMKPE